MLTTGVEWYAKLQQFFLWCWKFNAYMSLFDYYSQVLTNKLLHLIERSSDIEATQSKYIVNDVESQSVFDKDDDLIQFQEVSNILVTSNKPVQHELNEKDIPFIEIPDLYPVKHTVTLPKEHFYGTSKYRKKYFSI